MRAGEALRRMHDLPCVDLDTLAPGTTLVLVPHPDDESLGCGGLIAAACAHGRPPVVVVLTDGTGSHPNSPSHPPPRLRALREAEARAAVTLLGLPSDRLHFFGLPDTQAPHIGPEFDRVTDRIAALTRASWAETICTTWRHDPHSDHVAAHRIGAAAAQATGGTLLSYPVWGWTLPPEQNLPIDDIAGWRLDITADLPRKHLAIAAHASQCTALIDDDPTGFRLSAELLAAFGRPFEVFLRAA